MTQGMAKCPACGTENRKPAREWVGGAKTGRPVKVQRLVCASCGTGYVAWTDPDTDAVKTMSRKR